jgi:hypothetical protein
MTDQLEHDLRTMLGERAATVTADAAAGEQAIARRLSAGDTGVAEVVAHPTERRRRGVWVAAAAAAAILAIVLVQEDDRRPTVHSGGPTPTTPTPGSVAPRYLDLVGVISVYGQPCESGDVAYADGGCIDVAGMQVAGHIVIATARPEIEPDGGWGVRITFDPNDVSLVRSLVLACNAKTVDCPTGEIAVVLDDLGFTILDVGASGLGDDTLFLPGFDEDEARQLALALTASINDPPPGVVVQGQEDFTLGDPGDSAKDVAEQVMSELLADPSVTTGAQDLEGGATAVTMETSTGAEVVATVVFDRAEGAFRVTNIASPGIAGEVTPDGELFVQVGDAGTVRVRGFTEDFGAEVDATPPGGTAVEPGRQGPLPQPPDEYVWLVLRLETQDGRVLWGFSRR